MTISRARLLKELGIAPNGRDTQELIQKLKKLRAAMLTVKGPIRTERANLLSVFDEENAGDVTNRDRIHIAFDPLFTPLLENYIAKVPHQTSFQLKQLLAKWLYRYASTCTGEFRVSVEKLREWSGNSEDLVSYDPITKKQAERKAVSFAHFRSNLKKAASEIMEAAPGEFKTLRLERKNGEDGEGQLIIHRVKRAKVTIKKPRPERHEAASRRGGVVL